MTARRFEVPELSKKDGKYTKTDAHFELTHEA
jgi:hypothetical protein